MDTNPLVTIIMNCYNCEKFLRDSIESVIEQTYSNWEIIFWDNQSTDKSAQIVKSYNDKRIKYFYAQKHTSLGEARNKALKKANGEFISFLDCDDMYLPSRIEKTLQFFSSKEVGLVYTNGYILFDKNGLKKPFYKKPQPTGNLFEFWISSYKVMIPSVMFKKRVLNDLDYWFDTRFSMIEEFDFFVRIAKKYKVNYSDEKLCIWRAHSNSLTWAKRELFEKENKLFLENILSNYPELKNKNCIQKFKAKIAYQEFYNLWNKTGQVKRNILLPYLNIEKKLILVYIISFLGFDNFNKFLKLVGKNV